MKLRSIFVLPFFAAALFVVSTASAGEAQIKYRQAMMKAVGGHMGAMAGILKAKAGNPDHLAGHAQAMADLAKMAKDIFPAGSSQKDGKTEALDAIWEKPGDFAKVLATFEAEAAKLAAVAKGGDMAAFGAQLGALGKNGCGGCHKNFRKKKS